ncbi:hypothetical protein FAGKG844_10097 [Frankia sp. AgKG'84/4]
MGFVIEPALLRETFTVRPVRVVGHAAPA